MSTDDTESISGEISDLLLHPGFLFKSFFHLMAMIWPTHRVKAFFYRLRGTKIGGNVKISPFVFLEERYAHLISIDDNAQIGPGTVIVTHDSSLRLISRDAPVKTARVTIGKNVYIGAGAIILPGVDIGENSIIGAGSLVNKSIPKDSVAVGIPAQIICTVDEWKSRHIKEPE
jgi:acetyltransferase-like isoleucine patch superfamily enzyme